jgi:ubiquinone/menaquinone biosynthesis C-methylase UbiE
VPDPLFSDPRLAALYDLVDDDRSDLDVYAALVDEVGARSVLDVGCGTGTFACRLASAGKEVVGLDPARASLDVARSKRGADRVRWIAGDVTSLPSLEVDLVVMTGNVAMVFLSDDDWAQALAGVRRVLQDDSWFVFETRDPDARDWERWTKDDTFRTIETPTAGRIDTWVELTEVELPLVSFRHTFRFHDGRDQIASDSTLRFRTKEEVAATLRHAGLCTREVRDAPDRPGLEHVHLAQRSSG